MALQANDVLYGEENRPDWSIAKQPSELFIDLNHHEVAFHQQRDGGDQ
jgi:hypothetical protein